MARVGKNGPYLQCGEKSRSIRDDMAPDELTLEKAIELLDTPDDRVVGVDPESGLDVLARNGRFGPTVAHWLAQQAAKHFEVDQIDLAAANLPTTLPDTDEATPSGDHPEEQQTIPVRQHPRVVQRDSESIAGARTLGRVSIGNDSSRTGRADMRLHRRDCGATMSAYR